MYVQLKKMRLDLSWMCLCMSKNNDLPNMSNSTMVEVDCNDNDKVVTVNKVTRAVVNTENLFQKLMMTEIVLWLGLIVMTLAR